MISDTGLSQQISAPSSCSVRTTSRSETMPTTPSGDTTTIAPMLCTRKLGQQPGDRRLRGDRRHRGALAPQHVRDPHPRLRSLCTSQARSDARDAEGFAWLQPGHAPGTPRQGYMWGHDRGHATWHRKPHPRRATRGPVDARARGRPDVSGRLRSRRATTPDGRGCRRQQADRAAVDAPAQRSHRRSRRPAHHPVGQHLLAPTRRRCRSSARRAPPRSSTRR